jgi:hypothetical protein
MFVSRIAFLPSILFTARVPAEPQAGDMLTIVPFLALARELAGLLSPMTPDAEFRAELERNLIAEARHRATQDVLMPAFEPREGGERRWVKGAAAAAAVGSAVSIAGIVVYVLRRRAA